MPDRGTAQGRQGGRRGPQDTRAGARVVRTARPPAHRARRRAVRETRPRALISPPPALAVVPRTGAASQAKRVLGMAAEILFVEEPESLKLRKLRRLLAGEEHPYF